MCIALIVRHSKTLCKFKKWKMPIPTKWENKSDGVSKSKEVHSKFHFEGIQGPRVYTGQFCGE